MAPLLLMKWLVGWGLLTTIVLASCEDDDTTDDAGCWVVDVVDVDVPDDRWGVCVV